MRGSGGTSCGVDVVAVEVVSVEDLGDLGDLLLVVGLLSYLEKPVMPLFCVVA